MQHILASDSLSEIPFLSPSSQEIPRDTIRDVLGPSLPLCLPPDKSEAGAEIATWQRAYRRPSPCFVLISSGPYIGRGATRSEQAGREGELGGEEGAGREGESSNFCSGF